jgi:predicted GIY-YIG superfamily endonuclease
MSTADSRWDVMAMGIRKWWAEQKRQAAEAQEARKRERAEAAAAGRDAQRRDRAVRMKRFQPREWGIHSSRMRKNFYYRSRYTFHEYRDCVECDRIFAPWPEGTPRPPDEVLWRMQCCSEDCMQEWRRKRYAPRPTALYRWYDQDDVLLYVGVSTNVARRAGQHEDKEWWHRVARSTVEQFESRGAALDAESRAIREERPLFNIQQQR